MFERPLQEIVDAFILFRNDVLAYTKHNNDRHQAVVNELMRLHAENVNLKTELDSLKGSIAEIILLKG